MKKFDYENCENCELFTENDVEMVKVIDDDGNTIETLTKEDFESKYVQCFECGKALVLDCDDPNYEECYEIFGDYYCEDCKDELFECCEHCGEWVSRDDAIYAGDYAYCSEECAVEDGWAHCDSCGEWVSEDCVSYTEDTEKCYCEYCNDNLYYCDDCGYCFENDDSGSWQGDYDYWLCNDCGGNCNCRIKGYHDMRRNAKITFYFHPEETGNREDDPHIGCEIEAESRDGDSSCTDYIDDIEAREDLPDEFLHYERDGSLDACTGVENITQPATARFHTETLRDFYKFFFDTLKEYNYDEESKRCGLHMHIDCTYFGKSLDSATTKLCYIFRKFEKELYTFARRPYNADWCKSINSFGSAIDLVKLKKNNRLYDRYFCVNLINTNTIEIRMWSGTIDAETFFATVKMTDRLARLCKNTPSIKLSKLTWDEVLGDDPDIRSYWEKIKNKEVSDI